jgi:hypothetical protein
MAGGGNRPRFGPAVSVSVTPRPRNGISQSASIVTAIADGLGPAETVLSTIYVLRVHKIIPTLTSLTPTYRDFRHIAPKPLLVQNYQKIPLDKKGMIDRP